MKSLKGIISDTAFIGFVQISNIILTLLSISIIVKYLGAEQYGIIAMYKLFTVSGFLMLFEFGLRRPFAREIASARTLKNNKQVNSFISLLIVISILVSLVLISSSDFLSSWLVSMINIPTEYESEMKYLLFVTFVMAIVDVPSLLSIAIYEGFNNYKLLKTIELFQVLMVSIGHVLLVLNGYSYVELICYLIITTSVVSLFRVIYIFYSMRDSFALTRYNLLDNLELVFHQAKFYILANVSSVLGNNSANFIVSIVFSPTMVAYSDIIQKIPKVVKNAIGFVGQNLMVVTSERLAGNDEAFIKKAFNQGLKFYQFLLIPATIVISVFSYEIISLWLGGEYLDLSLYMAISILSVVLHPLASFGWNFLNGMAVKLDSMALFQWIVTFTKISILLVLSHFIGIWSVVLAMWAFVIVLHKNMIYYKRYLDLDVFEYFKSTILMILTGVIISFCVKEVFYANVFFMLIMATLLSYIMAYFVYLNNEDRKYTVYIIGIIKQKITKGKT